MTTKTINGATYDIAPGANLYGANLYGANLYGANLYDADLRDVNLRGADLRDANLYGANLYGANLYGANLYDADLRDVNLRGADLRDANLYGADLRGAKTDDRTWFGPYLITPETGSFTGWKKAYTKEFDSVIVKLRVGKKALRGNAPGGRKCRVSEAKVVAIETINGEPYEGVVHSGHDTSFKYTVGEIVRPTVVFDPNPLNECAPGIHLFLTRREAVDYR